MWLIFYTSQNPVNWEFYYNQWIVVSGPITDQQDVQAMRNELNNYCAKLYVQLVNITNMVRLDDKPSY